VTSESVGGGGATKDPPGEGGHEGGRPAPTSILKPTPNGPSGAAFVLIGEIPLGETAPSRMPAGESTPPESKASSGGAPIPAVGMAPGALPGTRDGAVRASEAPV